MILVIHKNKESQYYYLHNSFTEKATRACLEVAKTQATQSYSINYFTILIDLQFYLRKLS